MTNSFTPSFQHFHNDIERLLESEGKCTKNEHGQMVFQGYQGALDQMFCAYLEEEAFAPLVAEFRKWNWEWDYGDYLLVLTARLQQAKDWSLLKELWAAVVAKRRTNYNKTKTARKSVPDKVSEELVTKTAELLLDSLSQLQRYACECGREAEVGEYVAMAGRVERRLKA